MSELIVCVRGVPDANGVIGGPVQVMNADYTESCPKCGTQLGDEDHGFGLAYGGFGHYITCPYCPWFIKTCLKDEEM